VNNNTILSLETIHRLLGWPTAENVIHPKGAGASVFAELVKEKIGRSLNRFPETSNARTGVLMVDSDAPTSEPPIAIVVESPNLISDEALRELHRLSWNFSHAPILVTIEPTLLRIWSCCEAPDPDSNIESFLVQDLHAEQLKKSKTETLEILAVRALHWINLVSGQFFSAHADRFNRDGRADQMLLGNLQDIRLKLTKEGLTDDDICHDLLARVIFVQFLFDRKDQDGNPALTETKLHRLQQEGILQKKHSSFENILADYNDTYRLFDWLNTKFNGDLFPGKGETAEERAIGWANEKQSVKAKHLSILADFISGTLDMPSQQMCLWPQYAFDVIPLEFISSIYEAFVTERASEDGIFYTPPYLVDFVLDRVLPWDQEEWDLKIIDPACGSGIFLVKAFQRLVHRWKLAHPNQPLRTETLRRILQKNIFGVDKDPHAVRVACFSLYLAMCDEIEPRHYWTQVTFPSMRQHRLVCSDFFSEDKVGFNTEKDKNFYDLIIGNAPWGQGVITDDAQNWANSPDRNWIIPNKDIGGLFLAKSAQLVSENGRVALIQSANSLLFNINDTTIDFRKKLFSSHSVESIYNLSALRFSVFKRKTHTTKKSIAPTCVVIMRKDAPTQNSQIRYISPKHLKPLVDEFTIIIEPHDQKSLAVQSAIDDPLIWTNLMWGTARDVQLLKKLQKFPTIETLEKEKKIKSRRGVVFGDKKKRAPELDGKRIFEDTMFPPDSKIFLDASALPVIKEAWVHSRDSSNLEAFSSPQLIIKQSWNKKTERFHARLVSSKENEGIMCSQSYLSVHGNQSLLESICLAYNSKIAVYFLFLMSGRFAAYRPAPTAKDTRNLPIPELESETLENINNYHSIDAKSFELFALNDAERVLVEDAIDYRLSDFIGGEQTKGKRPTALNDENETHLSEYCDYFTKVLKAGFGQNRHISSTIFRSQVENLPFRLVAFQLTNATEKTVNIKEINSVKLIEELERLSHLQTNSSSGLYSQRIVRIYDSSNGVPTIFILKPDQKRFWTRSMGLQDGDEVALDLFKWLQSTPKNKEEKAKH